MQIMAMTLLAALLAVTRCLADQQADYIKQIRDGGPTEDFSQATTESENDYHERVVSLAEADAMLYFQDQKDLNKYDLSDVGEQRAFKHHLIGSTASTYSAYFVTAVVALMKTY
jgi:hypothetical protein